jgi:cytochrome b6-f complex iron-sulfur subunit
MTRTDRREFITAAARTVGVSLCGLAIGSLVQSCESDAVRPADANTTGNVVTLDVASEPSLSANGGAIKRTFGTNNNGAPVIVIRISDTSFMAFSAVCTHQGTIVNLPAAGSNVMVCPKHEEEFLITDGSPQTDTAPRPLQAFATAYDAATQTLRITF